MKCSNRFLDWDRLRFAIHSLILGLILLNLESCNRLSLNSDNLVELNSPNLQATDRESIEELIENAGNLHNAGMDAIGDINLGSLTSNTLRAELLLDETTDYFSTAEGWDISTYLTTTTLRDSLAVILDNRYQNDPDPYWQNYMSVIWLDQFISTQERAFVDEVRSVFLQDYSELSLEETCDEIADDLEGIRIDYDNTTWQSGAGHLAGGLIYLALGSTEFVRENYGLITSQNPNGGDPPPPQAYIQADCAGYILGWSYAVYQDYINGTLKPEGQWKRINAGVTFAVGVSMSVFKWWKF